MTGKITKIDGLKESHNRDVNYVRVYFELYMLDGRKFAKTDLVSSFRNYKRWERFLKVGTVLSGLRIKIESGRAFTVNADSFPVLISEAPKLEIPPTQSKLI